MKHDPSDDKWKRLTQLAQQAQQEPLGGDPPPLPPGLATRVAAKWAAGKPERLPWLGLFERSAWCGAGLAVLLCALRFSLLAPEPDPSPPFGLEELLFAPATPEAENGLLF